MSLPEPIQPSTRSVIRYMFRKIVKPVTRERRAEVQVQLRDSCTPDFDFFLAGGALGRNRHARPAHQFGRRHHRRNAGGAAHVTHHRDRAGFP